MSDRQTASAATRVKQQSMLLFHPVSAAVSKASLYNRDYSDSMASFKYAAALNIAIKKLKCSARGKLRMTAGLI